MVVLQSFAHATDKEPARTYGFETSGHMLNELLHMEGELNECKSMMEHDT